MNRRRWIGGLGLSAFAIALVVAGGGADDEDNSVHRWRYPGSDMLFGHGGDGPDAHSTGLMRTVDAPDLVADYYREKLGIRAAEGAASARFSARNDVAIVEQASSPKASLAVRVLGVHKKGESRTLVITREKTEKLTQIRYAWFKH